MFNLAKLDNLLKALPPPPDAGVMSMPSHTVFMFVGEAVRDAKAVYALKDENHDLVSSHAKSIPSSSWNAGVLTKLNMSLNKTHVVRSPSYIMKNGEAFPKSTKLLCWWCRHGFKTQPIGIPYRKIEGKQQYSCSGNYCSYECAMAGSVEARSIRTSMFAGSLLCLMRKHINGIALKVPLIRAPHWSSLKAYGGNLTIKQFRANTTSVRAIPEHLRLFPVGFNLFTENRKVNRNTKKRLKASLFDEAKKRSKIMKKNPKNKNYKTNFSNAKLKFKKKQAVTKNLSYRAPKKSKLKLF